MSSHGSASGGGSSGGGGRPRHGSGGGLLPGRRTHPRRGVGDREQRPSSPGEAGGLHYPEPGNPTDRRGGAAPQAQREDTIYRGRASGGSGAAAAGWAIPGGHDSGDLLSSVPGVGSGRASARRSQGRGGGGDSGDVGERRRDYGALPPQEAAAAPYRGRDRSTGGGGGGAAASAAAGGVKPSFHGTGSLVSAFPGRVENGGQGPQQQRGRQYDLGVGAGVGGPSRYAAGRRGRGGSSGGGSNRPNLGREENIRSGGVGAATGYLSIGTHDAATTESGSGRTGCLGLGLGVEDTIRSGEPTPAAAYPSIVHHDTMHQSVSIDSVTKRSSLDTGPRRGSVSGGLDSVSPRSSLGSVSGRPGQLKRGGTADAEYDIRHHQPRTQHGAFASQASPRKKSSESAESAPGAFAAPGGGIGARKGENKGMLPGGGIGDWKLLLPSGWSCPEGNNSGIMMAEDDDTRLTSTICPKASYPSSRGMQPVRRVALVVTDKPIPMEKLQGMVARSGMRQTSAPMELEGPGKHADEASRREYLARLPSYAPPPLADTPNGSGGLYPTLQKPSRHRRVDSPTDTSDWDNVADLMGAGLRRAKTGPNGDAAAGKVYYFEITVRLGGDAIVGLVPAESVLTPEQAQLLGEQSGGGGGGAATKPNPFPVLLDQSPGKSPNSVGLGCRDGRLRASGATVARNGEHFLGAAAQQADAWMDSSGLYQDRDTTIGCGWEIGGQGRIFFTRNGKMANPGRYVSGLDLNGMVMFPAVSIDTEGSDLVGNFGLDPDCPFVWNDRKEFLPINRDQGDDPDDDDDLRVKEDTKRLRESPGIRMSAMKPAGAATRHPSSLDASAGSQKSREDADMDNALRKSKIEIPAKRTTELLPPSKFEEAKEIARELFKAAQNPESDPRGFSNLLELCNDMRQRVVNTLGQEGVDFGMLVGLNEQLLGAQKEAEEAVKKKPSMNRSVAKQPPVRVSVSVDEPSSQPLSQGSGTPSSMTFSIPEIEQLVEKKDVFSLICLLRGHHDKRLAAAFALMNFAKDRKARELGNEIRSSGGLHSLLTLFKSHMAPPELKTVTALAVAYLLPSCDPEALLKVGMKLIDSIRYLINPNNSPPCEEISSSEMRVTAALALTHFWLYALYPKFSSTALTSKDQSSAKRRRDSRSILSNSTNLGLTAWTGKRGVEQRHETIENQELLERTVSLVVAVADSNVQESVPHDCEMHGELKTNVAFTVATICAVETARPIAVGEGVLKVLVRWLSSGDVDLVLQAANALRDLTSPNDEYMAGWIHSQIVNEDALPAIVKLSVHGQRDVRLAVAQILSGLAVAPHTRAAIVDAKGLNYLVQLLVNSIETVPWDETLALAAGSGLLQLAAGAIMHASGWARLEIGDAASTDRRDGVIEDIIQGGAIEPLAAMANSADRGKLRQLAVETLHVISEDVSPRRWTRQKLCEAGAAGAFGRILWQNAPGLRGLVERRRSMSESGDFSVNESQFKSSSVEAVAELHHALCALANILEPMSQEETDRLSFAIDQGNSPPVNPQDTLVSASIQTADSGGIRSLLLMTSLPVASHQLLQVDDISALDLNEMLVESCRSLASLCPLLISKTAAENGYAKSVMDILIAMSGILRRKVETNDAGAAEMMHQLQLDALRGLGALAEYEPLKIRIIDHSLSHVLQFKNVRGESADLARLAKAANQVCSAMGFSEDEIDAQLVGNDPKLLADWFCLERSMLLQAMAREEIREYLCAVWLLPLVDVSDEGKMPDAAGQGHGMLAIAEESTSQLNTAVGASKKAPSTVEEKEALLRRLYTNLGDDNDSAEVRHKLLQQYSYIYDADGSVTKTPTESEKTKSLLDAATDEQNSLLGISPCTVIGDIRERDWIMEHYHRGSARSKRTVGEGIALPARIQTLLDVHFPSRLVQSDVIPLADLRPESSFNFRALSMPQRRYFSFRREGQVLARVCEKHAATIDSEDVHWTLGFSNSSFAGEFAEILVQALYRCPIIQAMSFSKTTEHGGNRTFNIAEDGEDDGATLLANLAGSLPPWVTCLTFDNFTTKRSLVALIKRLETIGDHVGTTGKHHGTFDALAIRNSPRLGSESFEPFFKLLGCQSAQVDTAPRQPPLQSLRMLDLSGNLLGDECIASVLSIIHRDRSKCSIERLDVSGNSIKKGVFVTQVLRTYVQRYRQSNFSGDSWCCPLTWLNLSSNDLGVGESALEIVDFLKNNLLALTSLDLSNNGLSDENEDFLQVLSHSLSTNTKLVELNLKQNRFSGSFSKTLLHDIQHVNRAPVKLAFLHIDCDDSGQSRAYQDELNEFLAAGRVERLTHHFQGSAQSGVDTDESGLTESTGALQIDEKAPEHDRISDGGLYPAGLSPGSPHAVGATALLRKNKAMSEAQLDLARRTGPAGRQTPSRGNMLTVLFSAPLVWKDKDSNFLPIEMLDFELERELLWQCFKEASRDIELSFETATTDRLQATMTKSCACLHFSGHGHPEYLTFEDGKGGLHWLGVRELRNLITNGVEGGAAPFKFVFVSACHSGLAGQTFVDAGVPHVVCCQQESQLMDSAALAFTRAFYLALAIGRTVKDSFEIGRQAVAVSPTVSFPEEEMKKFVLLPENGNHDVPVFDAELVPEWPKKETRALQSAGMSRRDVMRKMVSSRDFGMSITAEQPPLPTTPQGFLGREIEMYKILNAFLSKPVKRLVSVTGTTGIGRSSLAAALCHYINDRKSTMFFETIFYIRAQQGRGNDRMGSVIYPLHKRLVAAGKASNLPRGTDIDDVSQSIFKALSQRKALIVFDRLEVLDGSEEAQEFPLFLTTLFQETKNVRVLVTAHKKMGIPSLGGVGENAFPLGPLNLKNTVRLFGMLCPYIHTGEERRRLIEDLVAPEEADLFASDGDISDRSRSLLDILGKGVPSRTYDAAYNMTTEEYAELKKLGMGDE